MDLPNGTSIIGAAKLTGKVGDSWNVGALSAVTGRELAELQSNGVRSKAEIEPPAYYGVFRAQKEFNDSRQAAIGLILAKSLDQMGCPVGSWPAKNSYAAGSLICSGLGVTRIR